MCQMQVQYVIVAQDHFHAEARLGGMRIGYVWCEREEDRLQISDIRVEREPPPRRRTFLRHIQALVTGHPPKQLRGRGIGSELLRLALRHADSTDIRETWGCVMIGDLNAQPTLLDWYKRRGFVVQEPDAECLPGTAKKIVRRRMYYN